MLCVQLIIIIYLILISHAYLYIITHDTIYKFRYLLKITTYTTRAHTYKFTVGINCIRCRATHDMVELDGGLLVLGGNDSNSSLHSTERYDPRINRWTMSTPMPTRRSSVGAALLHCFNMDARLTSSAAAAGSAQQAAALLGGQCVATSVTQSPFKSTATSV